MPVHHVKRNDAPESDPGHLVDTKHAHDAIAHVAGQDYTATTVTNAELHQHAAKGAPLHTIAPKERKPREKKA